MTITLRQETAAGATTKGSALTFQELDNNFVHLLRQGSVQVKGDTGDATLGEADRDSVLRIVGGTNVTTALTSDSVGDTLITINADNIDTQIVGGTDITVSQPDSAGAFTVSYTGSAIDNVVEDLSPQLGGSLDLQTHAIFTSTTNGSIILTPNGTGVVYSGSAISLADYGSSGYGAITGTSGVGFVALTNAGAQGASDPQFGLTNGGGAILTSGAGVLSFNGASATFNGINVNNIELDDYKETIYTGGSTTGTITPDVANGNVQKISLTGNITFNAFANAEAGQSMTLIIDTNGTGRTLTSTMLFAGGNKTLSTTDTVDILSVFYDGTTYYASLANNFS